MNTQCKSFNSYSLDNSAIIHLAARQKKHTNSFRITITLKEPVCGKILQKALNRITPRFPTVIAGIHRDFFGYHVVPVKVPPHIRKEQDCLAPMTKEEIRDHAFRVLYCENRISAEFFHSLTDGYGGMVVMTTLVAEYLQQKYGLFVPITEMILDTDGSPTEDEIIDNYFTYAGKKSIFLKHSNVYQLSGDCHPDNKILTYRGTFTTDMVLHAAHHYGVSMTTFLCAVMAASVMEIQHRNQTGRQHLKPVQIMVPVNLRKLFPSKTLRNFSLFALSCIEPQDNNKTFEELIHNTKKQLTSQTASDYMAAVMATYTKAERFPLYRMMPLPIKWLILHLSHQIFGEGNSCISISNLGAISLPEVMNKYIEGIDFILTPRIKSSYNCGIISFNGIISLSFSRFCIEPELEKIFFRKLQQFSGYEMDSE